MTDTKSREQLVQRIIEIARVDPCDEFIHQR